MFAWRQVRIIHENSLFSPSTAMKSRPAYYTRVRIIREILRLSWRQTNHNINRLCLRYKHNLLGSRNNTMSLSGAYYNLLKTMSVLCICWSAHNEQCILHLGLLATLVYLKVNELHTRDLRSFDSNWMSQFNSIRKLRANSKISNRRACHVCRRTINNTHCSTTNFNHFGIATGICIEFN